MDKDWQLRLACDADIAALEILIPLSVRTLQQSYYSSEQMEAALGPVFGVDRQLIRDRTYFVAERDGDIVGCGGWSRRRSMYGSDAGRKAEDAPLDPEKDPARMRAFFVHPKWARQGIARAIVNACENAIRDAGFRTIELAATLPGEPLYTSLGYTLVKRYEIPMKDGLRLPVAQMTKAIPVSVVRTAAA